MASKWELMISLLKAAVLESDSKGSHIILYRQRKPYSGLENQWRYGGGGQHKGGRGGGGEPVTSIYLVHDT